MVIMIMSIMAAGLFTIISGFAYRQALDTSVLSLVGDLRQTQQFSLAQRDGYKYYGLRFYDNLGPQGDRQGWKVLCYCQFINGTCVADPVLPINSTTQFRVIKSSLQTDNNGKGPEFLEDTFFARGVALDADSEFQVNPDLTQARAVIFIPEGAATYNGVDFLGSNVDEIKLRWDGFMKTISIIPLTGHPKIQ